jgi:glycosyltransferase involved in cell wall biosynthesis
VKPFAVLMSVYLREEPEFLAAALKSIFDQTVPPTQVVLVKDGPLTPPLDAVISEFEARHVELRVVPLEKNGGLGAALNVGIHHCDHNLIARMDSDDLAAPTRFEKQLTAFEKNPQLAIVGSWISEFESDPKLTRATRQVPVTNEEVRRTFGDKCPLNHPSIMFRKNEIIRAGGYRPDFVQEDYDLWGRMLAADCVFENIPECLVMMRARDDLFSRRGGWRYAVSEAKLQRFFLQLGLISWRTYFRNVLGRFIIRVMPNSTRKIFYRVFLR